MATTERLPTTDDSFRGTTPEQKTEAWNRYRQSDPSAFVMFWRDGVTLDGDFTVADLKKLVQIMGAARA